MLATSGQTHCLVIKPSVFRHIYGFGEIGTGIVETVLRFMGVCIVHGMSISGLGEFLIIFYLESGCLRFICRRALSKRKMNGSDCTRSIICSSSARTTGSGLRPRRNSSRKMPCRSKQAMSEVISAQSLSLFIRVRVSSRDGNQHRSQRYDVTYPPAASLKCGRIWTERFRNHLKAGRADNLTLLRLVHGFHTRAPVIYAAFSRIGYRPEACVRSAGAYATRQFGTRHQPLASGVLGIDAPAHSRRRRSEADRGTGRSERQRLQCQRGHRHSRNS